MPQLGEAISPDEFVPLEDHDENTCPWHEKDKGSAKAMDATDGEDDGVMPKTLGGKLKQNMIDRGCNPPDAKEVQVSFKTVKSLTYTVKAGAKIKEKLQPVFEDSEKQTYELQYAPHHCIPGNESLKDSAVVPFLGETNVIKNFNERGLASEIVDGKSVGYDVNCADNGVWLPSPYAISMRSNLWGAEAGLEALQASEFGVDAVTMVERFRASYVAESIHVSGRQFHMRHKEYSDFVRKVLDKIGAKIIVLASGGCPIINTKKEGDKFQPPMGLSGRLNALSREMITLLTGDVWRSPVFTDGHTESYAQTLTKAASTPTVNRIL